MKILAKKLIRKLARIYNLRYLFSVNKDNSLKAEGLLWRCKITCKGKGNKIIIKKNALLRNCHLVIYGNDNLIEFGERASCHKGEIWIEDDNNKVTVGDRTGLCGKIHLACIEGTRIQIGEDCLFSSDIVFRTGDSHSVLDSEGKRINPSKSIIIGNHVWVGNRVMIGKGVEIANDSIVGMGSVVTKSIGEGNVVIAGVPAKICKKDINWSSKRI